MNGEPLPLPEPLPAESTPSGKCPLCDAAYEAGSARCPSCGYFLEASSENPLTRPALWGLAAMVAAIYIVSLLIVVAAR